MHMLYIVARIFENILDHARIFLDHNSNISASHLWNNIIQTLQGNSMSPGNRYCLCPLKITRHALTKTSTSNPLGIF